MMFCRTMLLVAVMGQALIAPAFAERFAVYPIPCGVAVAYYNSPLEQEALYEFTRVNMKAVMSEAKIDYLSSIEVEDIVRSALVLCSHLKVPDYFEALRAAVLGDKYEGPLPTREVDRPPPITPPVTDTGPQRGVAAHQPMSTARPRIPDPPQFDPRRVRGAPMERSTGPFPPPNHSLVPSNAIPGPMAAPPPPNRSLVPPN